MRSQIPLVNLAAFGVNEAARFCPALAPVNALPSSAARGLHWARRRAPLAHRARGEVCGLPALGAEPVSAVTP